jgi:hypothetical protein
MTQGGAEIPKIEVAQIKEMDDGSIILTVTMDYSSFHAFAKIGLEETLLSAAEAVEQVVTLTEGSGS